MVWFISETLFLIFLVVQFGGNHDVVSAETNRAKRQLSHFDGGLHYYNRDIVIKYAWNNSVETEIPWIPEIFDYFQRHTCLNFTLTDLTDPDNKIIISYDDAIEACHASAGQYVKDGVARFSFEKCINGRGSNAIFHELQHSLGAHHPIVDVRSREFFLVTNDTYNKAPGAYQKMPELRNFGYPFDIGSNMNGYNLNESMPPMEAHTSNTYSHPFPTFGDLRQLNAAYNCRDLCDPEDIFRCSLNLGIPDSRNCSTCLCPDGFEGPTCNDRRRSMFDNPPCGATLNATAEPQIVTIDIKQGKNFENYNPPVNNISAKPLHPNVCVWHIRAPVDNIISIKVNLSQSLFDAIPNMTYLPTDTPEQLQYVKDNCFLKCLRAHLEIQLDNFDLKGYKVCCRYNLDHYPTFYSSGPLAVLIALSGWEVLPPLDVTYQAVQE